MSNLALIVEAEYTMGKAFETLQLLYKQSKVNLRYLVSHSLKLSTKHDIYHDIKFSIVHKNYE